MSEVIEALERLKNISEGHNLNPQIIGGDYWFGFIKKPEISSDTYIKKTDKLLKKWGFEKVEKNNLPKSFSLDGKQVLYIELQRPSSDTSYPFEIKGFVISGSYEKAKKLANYMLKLLDEPNPKTAEEIHVKSLQS
jgi:hypothetical protein